MRLSNCASLKDTYFKDSKKQTNDADFQFNTPLSSKSTTKGTLQTDESDSGTPILQLRQSIVKASTFKSQKQTQSTRGKVQSESELLDRRFNRVLDHKFRNLIFSKKIGEDVFMKHLQLTQRGLHYSMNCLIGPTDHFLRAKEIEVPLHEHKAKVLILDLDETLVHTCTLKDNPQLVLESGKTQIGLNIRPYLRQFLEQVSEYYTIYVFTASTGNYASIILDIIDPEQEYIYGIFTRTHCMETKNGFYIKDLRILKGVNLKDMVIVDNLSLSFGLQIDNGIPILEYIDNPKDRELKYLASYLIEASTYDDLREFNRQRLRLSELVNFSLS